MYIELFIVLLTVCGAPLQSDALPTDGCRAPADIYNGVSCDTCCDQNLRECVEYSAQTDWYNSQMILPGERECPTTCPKCALCSTRDESNLRELSPPLECDPNQCLTMEIGFDPCYARGSCQCFCETFNSLTRACPQVSPDWLSQSSTPPAVVSTETSELSTEAPWPGCAVEKQCLSGDVMPTGPNDQMASSLSCCSETEECVASSNPEHGSSCQPIASKPEIITWTMHGPWNLDTIQDESFSLLTIFTQTLHLSPFSTQISVHRVDGVVEVAFTTYASPNTMKLLESPMFRPRFEGNILSANRDLAEALFIGTQEVMAFYVLEGRWTLSDVQEFEENLHSQFAFVLGTMEEGQIETEIQTQGKLVQVIFKVKGSPVQVSPLNDGAMFTANLRRQIMATNPALSNVFGWVNLPDVNMMLNCPPKPPASGSCQGDSRCEYGRECCCGACFPSMVFTCDKGKWVSMYTDACLVASNCGDEEFETELEFEGQGGILRNPSQQHAAKESSVRHLVLLMMIPITLGILSGFITREICSKRKLVSNDAEDDMYVDLSLGTEDVARSV